MSVDILRYIEVKSQEATWYLLDNVNIIYYTRYNADIQQRLVTTTLLSVDTHTVWKKRQNIIL